MNTKRRINTRRIYVQRRGASVVEAAIMLPFLVILTFGSIDVAQYINTAQVISNASHEAARLASHVETQTVDEIKDAVANYFNDSMPSLSASEFADHVNIDVQKIVSNDNSGTSIVRSEISNGDLNTIESGDPISVDITVNFAAVRWLPGYDFGEIRTETISRRE